MDIKQYNFPNTQYIKEEHPKKQIYLHHTGGNPSGEGVFKWWESNKEKVATCVAINGKGKNIIDGQIIQGFSSKYWSYHLGLKESTFKKYKIPYISLDKISIAIEICNWGQLTEKNNKFYNYVNIIIPDDEVYKLDKPFKGFKYFHNYTDAQIESVRELLLLWNEKYNIPLNYNDDIFNINIKALKGEPGIYTHNSVHEGKLDIYPHHKMIEMLKNLKR